MGKFLFLRIYFPIQARGRLNESFREEKNRGGEREMERIDDGEEEVEEEKMRRLNLITSERI